VQAVAPENIQQQRFEQARKEKAGKLLVQKKRLLIKWNSLNVLCWRMI
jgi:hypothetical protein